MLPLDKSWLHSLAALTIASIGAAVPLIEKRFPAVGEPASVTVERFRLLKRLKNSAARIGELERQLKANQVSNERIEALARENADLKASTHKDGTATIVEPFMLVFMGAIIGTIVLAMFLPMFNIAQLGGA